MQVSFLAAKEPCRLASWYRLQSKDPTSVVVITLHVHVGLNCSGTSVWHLLNLSCEFMHVLSQLPFSLKVEFQPSSRYIASLVSRPQTFTVTRRKDGFHVTELERTWERGYSVYWIYANTNTYSSSSCVHIQAILGVHGTSQEAIACTHTGLPPCQMRETA